MVKRRKQTQRDDDKQEQSAAADVGADETASGRDEASPANGEEGSDAAPRREHGVENEADEEPVRGEPVFDAAPEDEERREDGAVDWEALQAERDGLMEEREQLMDQLLRARAEFDNYRKRVNRDSEQTRKMAAEAIVRDLLPIMDNLELAVEHAGENTESGEGLREGVNMVLKQMRDVLTRHGLESIESHKAPFDPNVHEALMQTHSDEVPADHVAQVFQKGYKLGDRILRPAKVVVSQGPAQTAETGETAGETLDDSPQESAKIRQEMDNNGG